jgi:hypothetical protein
LVASFIYFLNSSSQVKPLKAGSEDNVRGWAWSENIGWISFNNTSGGGAINYGVNINPETGKLSGYAWSENIGWIKFDPDVTNAPEPSLGPAKLDKNSGKITGWARACAGTINGDCAGPTRTDGWDGWIKMSGTTTNNTPYGISLDRSNLTLTGFAWGSDVIGWISFNCINRNVCTSTTPEGGPSDYKVMTSLYFNQPPYIESAEISSQQYCNISPGEGLISFEWTYNDKEGDRQSHYHLQIATDSGFNNIVVDREIPQVVESNKEGSSGVLIVPENPNAYSKCKSGVYKGLCLEYGKSYYWRVRVKAAEPKDQQTWSGWQLGSQGQSFTTPSHAYPWVDFSWTPETPSTGEIVQFFGTSTVYGGATISSWDWTFPNGNPQNSSNQNATTTFTYTGSKTVTLTVTDSDGFSCSKEKMISIQMPLPGWQEVPP